MFIPPLLLELDVGSLVFKDFPVKTNDLTLLMGSEHVRAFAVKPGLEGLKAALPLSKCLDSTITYAWLKNLVF